ncbi:MAG: hypothetical protein ABI593_06705, partial [Betaproteobacteria bacterium]
MTIGCRHRLGAWLLRAGFASVSAAAFIIAWPVHAQSENRLSITTGGAGGVYNPLGDGMARLLSKYIPGLHVE